jgi:hypothetical protein
VPRKPGNPTWGRQGPPPSPVASSFEEEVKALKLRPEEYAASLSLKEWARRNKDHKYVPSELLEAWGFEPASEV